MYTIVFMLGVPDIILLHDLHCVLSILTQHMIHNITIDKDTIITLIYESDGNNLTNLTLTNVALGRVFTANNTDTIIIPASLFGVNYYIKYVCTTIGSAMLSGININVRNLV